MMSVTHGIVMVTFFTGVAYAAEHQIDLSGTWFFQVDEDDRGEQERWFAQKLDDVILLPASTDERGFGREATEPETTRLTRAYRHIGPAWYQKTIEIPESWHGMRVALFLERAMWETKVWLDDHYIGMADSLCVPHRFDLTNFVTPGSHRLTFRIDNRFKINVGHEPPVSGGWSRMWTMALTEESQTNWNGVIGRMELHATSPVWIERVETYPDLDERTTRVVAFVRSRVGAVEGELTASAQCGDSVMGPVSALFRSKADDEPSAQDPLAPVLGDLTGSYYNRRAVTAVELHLPFGGDAKLWDEFSPSVYQLNISLNASAGSNVYRDDYSDTFGLRKFEADGKRLKLNGRTVFLRGNQDNCIHPETGYPPMDKAAWLTFLQKHKDYGLNHMRFHSWCPPKAAFEAADELGMLLQVETPLWDGHGDVGLLPERAAFIRYEAERILDEYGNHPSFCMMSIGNELGPDATEHYLQYLVEVLRQRDPRRLYTCTSSPAVKGRNDDFFVCAYGDGPARGLGHMNGRVDGNYSQALQGFDRPFISHEIGQYTSFPDFYSWFNEEKYTGPLKAKYIGLFKEKFEQHHPPERGPAFAKASGVLQALLYKTEFEAMLRTPEMSGFHMNGLIDYPGEGVALIGMLDAMADSKSILTPEQFRRFCSETVPLIELPKHAWSAGKEFEVTAMVRHHGPSDIEDGHWLWSIADQTGKVLLEGSLGKLDAPTGELTVLGMIQCQLPLLQEPGELTLRLRLEDSDIENAWRIWVYPSHGIPVVPTDVLVARDWSQEVRGKLVEGGRVLLTVNETDVSETVDIQFFTIFWGRGLFPHMLRPMGILCDPSHPALSQFPTRQHSDWQWYDLLTGACALNLNALPFEYEPVVFVIDDFNLSHRLGVLMEAKVGDGRLLISSLNLGQHGHRTPTQQQMFRSLLAHAGSDDFEPDTELTLEQLDQLLHQTGTLWQESRIEKPFAPGDPLFVEEFKGLEGGGEGTQINSERPLRHAVQIKGWKARGVNAAHVVQRSDGTWAFQVLSAVGGQHNTLTLNTGIAANEEGRAYVVCFEAGPNVYEMCEQATREGDQFVIELLRQDGSVLGHHIVSLSAWEGEETFIEHCFAYMGDGTGPIRIRVSPVPLEDTYFTGALSHLRILHAEDASQIPKMSLTSGAPDILIVKHLHEEGTQEVPYPSVTPSYTFAETLEEQEEQLKTNPLMIRFAESRNRLASDRYRPLYHFVSPESQLNDPNGLCFWQGRWHLFYQAYPPDEFPNPEDIPKRRQHWGHAVSEDLVHWRDLPYAIYPGIERMSFSGSTVVEEDQVVAFYPGVHAGQMVAISDDPLLLNWDKFGPVNSGMGDSCIWKEGDTYLGLTGRRLWSSTDLMNWEDLGEFYSGVEGACPNFVPIGDKHILLGFSHTTGGYYLLGNYDMNSRQYVVYDRGEFNHGFVSPGGVHAPSAASDGQGAVICVWNINDGKPSEEWDQIMSLPQRLTLGPDERLRIQPVPALSALRHEHRHVSDMVLPANEEVVLDGIQGDTMELDVEIDPKMARWVQLSILRSPNAEERTTITFYNYDRRLSIWYHTPGVISLDGSNSSTNSDVWLRPPEKAVMERGDEPLRLRVFIDRSVVEVYANDKQYLAMRVYPDRDDSVGVSLRAQGQDALLKRIDAWQMKSIWD